MKKLLAVLLAIIVVSTAFAGGGGDRANAGTAINTGASGSIDIGIAMPESHVLRWVKDGNALLANAQGRGYRAGHQNAAANQLTQNQQIQNFLTRGAKLLVIGNINEGVVSAVEEARRDDVKIIAYDRIIQGTTNYDCFITFNNYKVGQLQGQSIVDGLNLAAATTAAPKYITLFAGSPTDANANFFFQGAMDVLLPFITARTLVVVGPAPRNYRDAAFQQIATEGWDPTRAKARMENLLGSADLRTVTLDAVLAPNDTLGRAIIEALKADAKYTATLPLVTGQDAEFASVLSIKNGEQYSTVFKDTNKLAEAAILIADQLLKGEEVNVPGVVVAANDLREIGNTGAGYVTTYLLDPILVTKDNINVPVDAGFFTAAEAAQLK